MNLLSEHYWEQRAKASEAALEAVFNALLNLDERVGGERLNESLINARDTWRVQIAGMAAGAPITPVSRATVADEPAPRSEGVDFAQVQAMLTRHLSDAYIKGGDAQGFLPDAAYATHVGSNFAMVEPHGTVTKMWLQQPMTHQVTLTIRAGSNGIAYMPDQLLFRIGVDNWQVWEEDTVVLIDLDQAEIELIHFIETFKAGMERTGGG